MPQLYKEYCGGELLMPQEYSLYYTTCAECGQLEHCRSMPCSDGWFPLCHRCDVIRVAQLRQAYNHIEKVMGLVDDVLEEE